MKVRACTGGGRPNMTIKTVKVSEKGQIAIPRIIRERVGIEKGDELVVFQEDKKIMLQKIQDMKGMNKHIKSEFYYLVKLSEGVAKKLWSSKKDEAWDKL